MEFTTEFYLKLVLIIAVFALCFFFRNESEQ
jgi:hypothetical protein